MRIYRKLVADRWLKAANYLRLYHTYAMIAAIRRVEDDSLTPAVNQAAADAVESQLDWLRRKGRPRSLVWAWMDETGLEIRLMVLPPAGPSVACLPG